MCCWGFFCGVGIPGRLGSELEAGGCDGKGSGCPKAQRAVRPLRPCHKRSVGPHWVKLGDCCAFAALTFKDAWMLRNHSFLKQKWKLHLSLSCKGGFKVIFLKKRTHSFVGEKLGKLSPPDWRVKSVRFKSNLPSLALSSLRDESGEIYLWNWLGFWDTHHFLMDLFNGMWTFFWALWFLGMPANEEKWWPAWPIYKES